MAQEQQSEGLAHAPMDYPQHERTYGGFLWLVKHGTIAVIAILLGMLAGLIASWGIIASVFVVVATYLVLSFVLG